MKRAVALVLSLLIMAVIFARIDRAQFVSYLRQMDLTLLAVAIVFFIPQVGLSAYRWKEMVKEKVSLGCWEAIGLILTANALNILLPSRVGDLSKAYFMKRAGQLELKRGMNIVIFEKYIDLAALGVVVLVGLFFAGRWDEASGFGLLFASVVIGIFPLLYFFRVDHWLAAPWFEQKKILAKIKYFLMDTQDYLFGLKGKPKKLCYLVALSVVLWFVHLLQFWVIFRALHSDVSIFHIFRLVPLAILVGLLPITIAGVGTRDSALLYFFSPYEAPALIVGVGLFASLRYFVPGVLGLPFLNRYIVKDIVKQDLSTDGLVP